MTDEEKKLRNYAIWLLSRQEYSCHLMRQKLLNKGASEQFSEETLEWLLGLGYIDDQRYAESYINRQLAKGLGEKRVLMDAYQKGIERALLIQLIEEKEIDWFAQAQQTYIKKYGLDNQPKDYQDKSKRIRYMTYRGFGFDEIDFAMQTDDV